MNKIVVFIIIVITLLLLYILFKRPMKYKCVEGNCVYAADGEYDSKEKCESDGACKK